MNFISPFPKYQLDNTAHSARSRPNGLCYLAGILKTGRWKSFFSFVLYCLNHEFIDSINLNLLAIRKGIKAVLGTCEYSIILSKKFLWYLCWSENVSYKNVNHKDQRGPVSRCAWDACRILSILGLSKCCCCSACQHRANLRFARALISTH